MEDETRDRDKETRQEEKLEKLAEMQRDVDEAKAWIEMNDANVEGYPGDKFFIHRPPFGSTKQEIDRYIKKCERAETQHKSDYQPVEKFIASYKFEKRKRNDMTKRYFTDEEQRKKHEENAEQVRADIWHEVHERISKFPGDEFGMVRPEEGFKNMNDYLNLARQKFMARYPKPPKPPPKIKTKRPPKRVFGFLKQREEAAKQAAADKLRAQNEIDPEEQERKQELQDRVIKENRARAEKWQKDGKFPGENMFPNGPERSPIGKLTDFTDAGIRNYMMNVGCYEQEQKLRDEFKRQAAIDAKKRQLNKAKSKVRQKVVEPTEKKTPTAEELEEVHQQRLDIVRDWEKQNKFPGDDVGIPRANLNMTINTLTDYIATLGKRIVDAGEEKAEKEKMEEGKKKRKEKAEQIKKLREHNKEKSGDQDWHRNAPKRRVVEKRGKETGENTQSTPIIGTPRPPMPGSTERDSTYNYRLIDLPKVKLDKQKEEFQRRDKERLAKEDKTYMRLKKKFKTQSEAWQRDMTQLRRLFPEMQIDESTKPKTPKRTNRQLRTFDPTNLTESLLEGHFKVFFAEMEEQFPQLPW